MKNQILLATLVSLTFTSNYSYGYENPSKTSIELETSKDKDIEPATGNTKEGGRIIEVVGDGVNSEGKIVKPTKKYKEVKYINKNTNDTFNSTEKYYLDKKGNVKAIATYSSDNPNKIEKVEKFKKRKKTDGKDTFSLEVPTSSDKYSIKDGSYRKADKAYAVYNDDKKGKKTIEKFQKKENKREAQKEATFLRSTFKELVRISDKTSRLDKLSSFKTTVSSNKVISKADKRKLQRKIKQEIKFIKKDLIETKIRDMNCNSLKGKEKRKCKKAAKNFYK